METVKTNKRKDKLLSIIRKSLEGFCGLFLLWSGMNILALGFMLFPWVQQQIDNRLLHLTGLEHFYASLFPLWFLLAFTGGAIGVGVIAIKFIRRIY
jgi:hypothetical protein